MKLSFKIENERKTFLNKGGKSYENMSPAASYYKSQKKGLFKAYGNHLTKKYM